MVIDSEFKDSKFLCFSLHFSLLPISLTVQSFGEMTEVFLFFCFFILLVHAGQELCHLVYPHKPVEGIRSRFRITAVMNHSVVSGNPDLL